MAIWACIGLIFNDYDLVHRLLELFKLCSIFIMFYALSTLPPKVHDKLKNFYFYTLIVVLVNISLSLLGYGMNSYGDYGAKGFLFGGNALSSVIVILGVYYLGKAYNKGFLIYFFTVLSFIFLSFIVGTKSAILGILLAAFIILVMKGKLRDWLALLVLWVIVFFILLASWNLIESTAMYARLSYFYYGDGLERLLFSGRLDFLRGIWNVYVDSGIKGLLFGIGKEQLSSLSHDISEMDVTDVVFSFGFVTLLVYLVSFLVTIVFIYVNSSYGLFIFAFSTTVVLFLIGAIAGHVLFNGVVTPFWALVLVLPVLEPRRKKLKNRMRF
ncbi:O-antigen ligase family protein [Vibrio parahaemolyticus]|nr:O-antigen ligase family protein [Vibrio parahaemolyticus]